jgi:hypothetical protein
MHRLPFRGLAPLILVTAVVLLSGCSGDATSNASATPQATATPLAEHLVFHGDLSGTITTGIDVRPFTHDNPVTNILNQPSGPAFTQCSTFDSMDSGTIDDYTAVIVGMIGNKRYTVTVEINMDDPVWTHPGTTLELGNNGIGGSVGVYEAGGQNRQWAQVYGPAMQAPVVVLHADRKSGTVDAWMATTDQSMNDATATLHLQGDWRCG